MTGPAPRVLSVQTTEEAGGGEYANVDLLVALITERGFDATLVTNAAHLADGTPLPTAELELGPKLSRSSVRWVGVRAPVLAAGLDRTLRALGPADAVLLHYKKEQLLSLALRPSTARRIVWAEWGPLPFPLRRGPARLAYLAAARRARAIVCVSQGTADSIVAAGVPATKVAVVPNLVDTTPLPDAAGHRARLRRAWGLDDDAIAVVCVSRFQHKKRNDVLVDAHDHLDDPRVVVLFAGAGPDEAALRASAARHGDRVRFLGTPRGWIRELLAAADLSVFAPSPTEGAPRAIILTQLGARPVVATAAEGATGLVPDGTGTILEPAHDPRALAALLRAYADDPDRRRREGEAGRVHAASRYDRDRVLDDWATALLGTAA